jgi:hypothetical protein
MTGHVVGAIQCDLRDTQRAVHLARMEVQAELHMFHEQQLMGRQQNRLGNVDKIETYLCTGPRICAVDMRRDNTRRQADWG